MQRTNSSSPTGRTGPVLQRVPDTLWDATGWLNTCYTPCDTPTSRRASQRTNSSSPTGRTGSVQRVRDTLWQAIFHKQTSAAQTVPQQIAAAHASRVPTGCASALNQCWVVSYDNNTLQHALLCHMGHQTRRAHNSSTQPSSITSHQA